MGLGLLRTQKVVEAQRDSNLPGGLWKDFLEAVTCGVKGSRGRAGGIFWEETPECAKAWKCASAGLLGERGAGGCAGQGGAMKREAGAGVGLPAKVWSSKMVVVLTHVPAVLPG